MSPFSLWISNSFYLATVFYLLGLCALIWPRRRLGSLLLALGLACNLVSIGIRLYYSWPMQAPYQEPFWLPACLAIFALGLSLAHRWRLARWLIPLIAGLALWAALFPKDYYLPFPRSNTIFSHLFLLLSAWGKACLWVAGVDALRLVLGRDEDQGAGNGRPLFLRLIVWGFVVYTLSLFVAETWSYLGWSSPVIWEDNNLPATMGTWFYYGCFLHLYLLRGWDLKRRGWFAALGMLLLFYFNYLPETGEFKPPVFL